MQISGDIISRKKWKDWGSYYDIEFDQTVAISEYFYFLPSLSTLCADLGGALGFWLGLGILQLCVNAIDFVKDIRIYFGK